MTLQAPPFGSRRIYYNNFAEHLQNAYNPNLIYPGLPNCWTDDDWRNLVGMIADFGYTVFEYWLVPRLFCREALDSDFGRDFARTMETVAGYAHERGLQMEFICGLATVGDDWHTHCPNLEHEWAEIQYLWNEWTRRLPSTDIVGIFPGDPGACSRNGCTALTYIDRSCDIAGIIKQNLPEAEIELHTWGPPVFGWGNITGPENWQGEFIQTGQGSAWAFDKQRADDTMNHLLRRLPDFPADTSVAINLGFNPDGIPEGDQDARPWAREIARTHRILSWDFSLTEGENNVVPHYRFERLFAQRRREREAAPYSGGICYTMTPMLNQLSLWMAAQSFLDPDADPHQLAGDFYERLYGPEGRRIAPYLPLFEVVKDWGNHLDIDPTDPAYHQQISELRDLLQILEPVEDSDIPFHPSPDTYHRELLFFADLFTQLSAPNPNYDALAEQYWKRVYGIYDHLPEHVDPRTRNAVKALINRFRGEQPAAVIPGKWVE